MADESLAALVAAYKKMTCARVGKVWTVEPDKMAGIQAIIELEYQLKGYTTLLISNDHTRVKKIDMSWISDFQRREDEMILMFSEGPDAMAKACQPSRLSHILRLWQATYAPTEPTALALS